MQCSKETITRLFYNVSSSFTLLFFFFYFTSIFLSNFFCFLGGNLFFPRNQDEYEFGEFSDEESLEQEEEEEEENEHYNNSNNIYNVAKSSTQQRDNHLVADILDRGERLMFLQTESSELEDGGVGSDGYDSDQRTSVYSSPALDSIHSSDDDDDEAEEDEEEILARDDNIETNPNDHQSTDLHGICEEKNEANNNNNNLGSRRDIDREKYLDFAPSINNNNNKAESKKLIQPQERVDHMEEEDIFGDSCTVGSTSKSSSEWRSSIRDSGTDDPFSSSSRRSCPKWESYTVFQKYDEEMLFLDRISAQKLHETESLRSIQSCPRSISDRIVYKLAAKNKNSADFRHNNPYHELEGAYVAQICWTWEALNYNYKYFQRLRSATRREQDHGCPAYIAQQFQQFLVLLQRYVENEPYEHGRRPEIYARMRSFAPKLLQVPEYRDSEDEKKEESMSTRISSDSFLEIMEEVIKTFMEFLKADKANKCQMIAAFFRRNRRGSVDPTLLFLLKKVNKKKKIKVKELRRRSTGGCLRKRKLRMEEEMEILMALIDLKVVSRVLRMKELNDEQLHWCEDKMTKVKVSDGKLQRDSSPLFFPAR